MNIDDSISSFNENGYGVLEDVLSNEECDKLIRLIKETAEKSKTYIGGYLRESNLLEQNIGFAELMDNEVVLQICNKLLGEHFRIMSTEAIIRTKEEDDPVRWHEDGPNSPSYRDVSNETPVLFQLKFGFFLNDLLENDAGNLTVIPGSHKFAKSPFDSDSSYLEENKKQLTFKKGSIIFFHNALWHCVNRNLKDEPRYNLYYTYCYPWMAPFDRSASSLILKSLLNENQKKLLMDFETPSHNYTLIKETWRGDTKKVSAAPFKILSMLLIRRLKVLKRKILGGSLN